MLSLVNFQEFSELKSYLRHVKASWHVLKCSSVLESAIHRKPHLYVQTAHLILEVNNLQS